MREKEEFRDIPGYEGLYQVSNLGTVKSLQRKVIYRDTYRIIRERILKPIINSRGYYFVNLCSNGKCKTIKIHQLVTMTFLEHKPDGNKMVVDHIDNNKLNNNVNNLQLISNRENCSKDKFRKNKSSKYIGVCLHKQKYKLADGSIKIWERWIAQIYINDKILRLGSFKSEEEAAEAYQNKLEQISK